ncbi:hypothetical protein AFE_0820 [Acidithiobacillus ferrooxidans ATCC 23270]|uniref:Uncharacterized protein n=1 Tax=Acidithiobacillus ferrooxidans (strain ATCC 23270 / DSM 14882 / CIP 104768 / NCIMB 8455) TaxID=243159 RepID=B7J6N6_ACIF2|nr:hypothetical protein AFE_0820 [Acidithiobacillus ferrooxidans ATCC 23270]
MGLHPAKGRRWLFPNDGDMAMPVCRIRDCHVWSWQPYKALCMVNIQGEALPFPRLIWLNFTMTKRR